MNQEKTAQMFVGLAVIVGFFAAFYASYVKVIDGSMRDIVLVFVGWLGSKFSTVVDYHYGSSSGSARKDEIMRGKDDR
jgi:hypothetical protein